MDTAANKFMFTEEGRKMLISQVGGIKFAIAGALLVQGIDEISPSLTFEQLTGTGSVVLGMPGINYVSYSTGMVRVSSQSQESYNNALKNIYGNLFPVTYIPCREISNDNGGSYGSYEIDFDRTAISWDMANDISFDCLALIGKQYAETNDAVFNVDNTQNPVIVGYVQSEGGIQFLKDANEYVSFKLNLKFTLTDKDNDATELLCTDTSLKEMSEKINIINDGLKTNADINIVDTDNLENTLVDLNLSERGSFAATKSLMVADPYGESDIDNQFNAAGQVHIINKKDTANGSPTYREQLILTTLEEPDDYSNSDLTGYYAGISLKGSGKDIVGTRQIRCTETISYTGTESPEFRITAIDESDNYGVDIFGIENKFLTAEDSTCVNGTKSLFSIGNISLNPIDPEDHSYAGNDILVDSKSNLIESSNGNNLLIKADNTWVSGNAHNNVLIDSNSASLFGETNNNIIIGTRDTIVSADPDNNTYNNIILGGNDISLSASVDTTVFNGTGICGFDKDEQYIFGKYNADTEAKLVYGNGTAKDSRNNALEFYPDTGILKLYDVAGNNTVTIGGTAGVSADTISINEIDSIGDNVTIKNTIIKDNELKVIRLEKNTTLTPGAVTIQNRENAYTLSATSSALIINNNNLADIAVNTVSGNLNGDVTGTLFGDVQGGIFDGTAVSANKIRKKYTKAVIEPSTVPTSLSSNISNINDTTVVVFKPAVVSQSYKLYLDVTPPADTELILDFQTGSTDKPLEIIDGVNALYNTICYQSSNSVRKYLFDGTNWECLY